MYIVNLINKFNHIKHRLFHEKIAKFVEKKSKENNIRVDILCMNDSNNDNNLTNKKGSKMYGTAAHNTYAQNNVGIESPTRLIEMLYEGVLRFNAQAKKSIKENDIEKKIYWINRSIAIITELVSVLDKSQGDVSLYLEGLYNYQLSLLTKASMDGDIAKIDEVSNVFKGLLEAWRDSTNVD